MRLLLVVAGLVVVGCSSSDEGNGSSAEGGMGGSPNAGGAGGAVSDNTDGDCLSNAEEAELGTDPTLADSDADGTNDCDEIACGANPVDGADQCYACGWMKNDPGTLVSTGAAVGDVIGNFTFADQCGDTVDLWDFAGGYRLLFLTASWCAPCRIEAEELEDRAAAFRAETGLDFDYIIALNEDTFGLPPDAEDALLYSEAIETSLPVLADPSNQVTDGTPWDATVRPGKCVLSPEMVMIHCYVGEGDEEGFEAIRNHAGL